MKKIIQVHIYKSEAYFVAECLDLPVVTQGKTLDELASNLQEAIGLALEGEDPATFGLSEKPSIMASIEIETPSHASA
jgi:predicted RNase H-like HicB family nuclease